MSGSIIKQTHDLLCFQEQTRIVDVGANPIEGAPPYESLLVEGLCLVTGFEPNLEALAALDAKKSSHETYLPYAIGDGSRKKLNLCRHSGWTSTLVPSELSLDVFSAFKENAAIIAAIEIETKRLDDVVELGRVDFLKIDIQGGELDVFNNAQRTLANAAVIHTEAPFVPLYENQPTLGEIDVCLRALGFIPHCFAGVKTGMISPLAIDNNPWLALRQLLDADIVYVRDFRDPTNLTDDQLRHLGLIAHACYGSYDLACRCVLLLEQRNVIPAGSVSAYVDLVNAALKQKRA